MDVDLSLKARDGGWQLIDNGRLSFWFPERDQALEVALAMVDCRSRIHGSDLVLEAETLDGEVEMIECRYSVQPSA